MDGTALALQIGHCFSIDLDLFTTEDFEVEYLQNHLVHQYDLQIDNMASFTIQGSIRNVKMDFLRHAYPLVRPLLETEKLRLASLEDIAAMKLNAISISGQRIKDFIDVYFLLEKLSLEAMVAAYQVKYIHSNKMIPLKALTYFDDLDTKQNFPKMVRPVTWKNIEKRLITAIEKPHRIFD